jgi:hypothetical protein
MGEPSQFPPGEGIEYVFAQDGHLVAMAVRSSFEDYDRFPPFPHAEERRTSVQTADDMGLGRQQAAKAQITPREFPLQITLLKRDRGAAVRPHYHRALAAWPGRSSHQVMFVLQGRVRIGVYTVGNEYLADISLDPGDLILMTEGHEVEFLEPGTKVIEIKQGPLPAAMADEIVALGC